MSADNAIVILKTTDKFRVYGNTLYNMFGEELPAYRVAHIQAVDNFDYYVENEIHNLGYWMYYTFGKETPVYVYDTALKIAHKLLDSADYVEYGIVEIDASKYNFPGC